MPITGPGSRSPLSGVTGTTGTTSTQQAEVAQPTVPAAPAAGWSAGVTNRPALNLGLPPPTVSASDIEASLPNPVRQQLQGTVDRYTARVETTLGHDAMSIARGKTPVREGDQLTEAQQGELNSATMDLIKDLPIGALSPELAASVTQKLGAAGFDTRDVSTTKLKDFGQIGGDVAKDLVKDLKANSPTGYYSLAATLAAGIGYTAWNDGSAKLNRLGVKPEIKQGFLDNKLELKLQGDWKAHFKDFNTTATLTGRTELGGGTLSGSVSANSKTGFERAQVDYNVTRDTWNLSTTATANRAGLESVGASANWSPQDDLRLSASVNHNFQTDRTTATAEASWKASQNVDFGLSASHDSAGESRVGIGARIRF